MYFNIFEQFLNFNTNTSSTLEYSFIIFFLLFCFMNSLVETSFLKNKIWSKKNILINSWIFLEYLLKQNLGFLNENMFIFLFSIFYFLVFNNILSLISYQYSILLQTWILPIIIFIYLSMLLIKSWKILKWNYCQIFIPINLTISWSFFIIPMEFFLYWLRPIILNLRLIANIITGHLIIKCLGVLTWNIFMKYTLISYISFCLIFFCLLLFFFFWNDDFIFTKFYFCFFNFNLF